MGTGMKCKMFNIRVLYYCIILPILCNVINGDELIDEVMTVSLKGITPMPTNSEVYYTTKNLDSMSRLTVNVENISPKIAFLIMQAHSFQYNITVSYIPILDIKSHVNGTNLGLIYEPPTPKTFFISNFNDNSSVIVYISIHAYSGKAPIPGGCNMEFNVLDAPYLHVGLNPDTVTLEAAPARLNSKSQCDNSSKNIHHDFYHLFLTETNFSSDDYFAGLKKMITVENILQHGRKVPRVYGYAQMRRLFSLYRGTGSIFAVISTNNNVSSAYVPSHTYGCPSLELCEHPVYLKAFFAVISIVGLFICLLGHYFFKTQMVIFGFLFGSTITYLLTGSITSISFQAVIGIVIVSGVFFLLFWMTLWRIYRVPLWSIFLATFLLGLFLFLIVFFGLTAVFATSIVSGVLFGIIWLHFWRYVGIPLVAIMVATLSLGFHVASIVYFGIPDGISLLQADLNFWSIFLCVIMIVNILILPLSHHANIMSCVLIGSFAALVPLDLFMGSHLRYIVVNVIRRATVENFSDAIIDPPYQWRDALMTGVWAGAAIVGFLTQYLMSRGKPPFPPPPRISTSQRPSAPAWEHDQVNERSPFLGDDVPAPRMFGAVPRLSTPERQDSGLPWPYTAPPPYS